MILFRFDFYYILLLCRPQYLIRRPLHPHAFLQGARPASSLASNTQHLRLLKIPNQAGAVCDTGWVFARIAAEPMMNDSIAGAGVKYLTRVH